MADPRPIYQPLHDSIRPLLDPEYVDLHDSLIQYILPTEHPSAQWTPATRLKPSAMAHCVQRPVPVGAVYDLTPSKQSFQARVFVPDGEAPEPGWPGLVWFHGGGWVNGGLGSDEGFLTHLCHYVRCVVITINYRHAPEYVYPAAHDDALAAWRWVIDPVTPGLPKLHLPRLAIGGMSAGGNLAISTTLQTAHDTVRPFFQLLVCPVINNTATTATVWDESRHSPFLTPSRMEWYRQQYFGKPGHRREWRASPCFARITPPRDMLPRSSMSQSPWFSNHNDRKILPPAFIAIAGCDLLAPEERAFAEQLEKLKVEVQVREYAGATHSVLVLAGVHKLGKEVVHDASAALASAFRNWYDREKAPILGMAENSE